MYKRLNKRPFMIISYSRKLKEAWSVQEGEDKWDAIENMVIADSVSNTQLQYADFIIDLLNKEVVKNRMGVDPTLVYQSYVDRYYDDVKAALATWVKRSSSNLDVLQDFLKNVRETEEGENGEGNSN
jgi:hypothetical protein